MRYEECNKTSKFLWSFEQVPLYSAVLGGEPCKRWLSLYSAVLGGENPITLAYFCHTGEVSQMVSKCLRNCSQSYQLLRPDYAYISQSSSSSSNAVKDSLSLLPTIYVITPTHTCTTQKVDLTSLCQTLGHVPRLVWIVIEDSDRRTKLVSDLLQHCMVESVHLNVATSEKYKSRLPWPLDRMWGTIRGVEQRNAGLKWLREHRSNGNRGKQEEGVVYFADDDNKFDLRIFPEVSKFIATTFTHKHTHTHLILSSPYILSVLNLENFSDFTISTKFYHFRISVYRWCGHMQIVITSTKELFVCEKFDPRNISTIR